MTTTDPGAEAELELRLAEFKELKAEQRARIERRDHLVYATLTAIVAAAAAAVKVPLALLLLAPAVLILGWTHLINDAKVSAAGEYLRGPFGRRLAELAGTPDAVLGWEFAHRGDERRHERKAIQLIVDLATFIAPALGGMVGYLALGGTPPVAGWLALVALAGATGILAQQQLAYAEVAPLATLRLMWHSARAARRRRLSARP